MTRSTNMEHVEVLRAMLVDEYPEGSDDGSPTFTLERAALTAAIASLSAPAEWNRERIEAVASRVERAGDKEAADLIRDLLEAGIEAEQERIDTAPPSAPVGVEGVEAALQKWLDWCNEHGEEPDAKSGAMIAIEALAQQPVAGEEIMVDAAHDVYTLPLQPSGLSSGPRFVVHVPGPEQPAAVNNACAVTAIQFALNDPEGMTFLRLWNEGEFETLRREWPEAPSSIYTDADALAAQQGGSNNDR